MESASTLYCRRSFEAWQYGEEQEEGEGGREQDRRVEQGAAWQEDDRVLGAAQELQSVSEDESPAYLAESVDHIRLCVERVC